MEYKIFGRNGSWVKSLQFLNIPISDHQFRFNLRHSFGHGTISLSAIVWRSKSQARGQDSLPSYITGIQRSGMLMCFWSYLHMVCKATLISPCMTSPTCTRWNSVMGKVLFLAYINDPCRCSGKPSVIQYPHPTVRQTAAASLCWSGVRCSSNKWNKSFNQCCDG